MGWATSAYYLVKKGGYLVHEQHDMPQATQQGKTSTRGHGEVSLKLPKPEPEPEPKLEPKLEPKAKPESES